MNWQVAIERNRAVLLRLAAVMFAAIDLKGGTPVSTVPRFIRLHVLGLLRPSEAALRRLIVIKARGLVAPLLRARPHLGKTIPRGKGKTVPAFPLFDPRKKLNLNGQRRRYARGSGPRISSFDEHRRSAFEDKIVSPDDPVDAAALTRRLLSLKAALDDVGRQARRLVRVEAARKARADLASSGGVKRSALRPMRPGRPPGHQGKGRREIDEILAECHTLALHALAAPDTS